MIAKWDFRLFSEWWQTRWCWWWLSLLSWRYLQVSYTGSLLVENIYKLQRRFCYVEDCVMLPVSVNVLKKNPLFMAIK